MEFRARQKWLRLSPQKARLVANVVRGMDVQEALDTLKFMPQKAALFIGKAVKSALANAREYKGDVKVDVDKLYIKKLTVDGGPFYKRIKPRAYGRAHRILRPTSHITVHLAERPEGEGPRRRVRAVAAAAKRAALAQPKEQPAAATAEAEPKKPKKPRFFAFRSKDKYGAKVKSEGEHREHQPPEHRKTERGTSGGRKGK